MGMSDALSCHSDHGLGSDDKGDLVLLFPELFTVHALEGLTLVGEECGIIRNMKRVLLYLDYYPENILKTS